MRVRKPMLRIGWFSTGRGPGSRNLLKAVMDERAKGKLDIEIAFVFCNWDNTEDNNPRKDQRQMFFDMVRGYGIPLILSSWKKFKPELRRDNEDKWRAEYGKSLREKTRPFRIRPGNPPRIYCSGWTRERKALRPAEPIPLCRMAPRGTGGP